MFDRGDDTVALYRKLNIVINGMLVLQLVILAYSMIMICVLSNILINALVMHMASIHDAFNCLSVFAFHMRLLSWLLLKQNVSQSLLPHLLGPIPSFVISFLNKFFCCFAAFHRALLPIIQVINSYFNVFISESVV